MAQMSMNKVIHAAIRRDLDRFNTALAAFPVGDPERARQLGRAWDNFQAELTHHHEGEHEIAWPALEQVGVRRSTLEEMDAEHHAMATAMTGARSAMSQLQASPGADEAAAAAVAMQWLRDVTVVHLDHEEQEIEPVYLANSESPAIKEMSRKFSRAQSPPQAGRFFAWVTDGASAEVRDAVEQNVPRPVLAILRGVFGRGYRKEIAPVWTASA